MFALVVFATLASAGEVERLAPELKARLEEQHSVHTCAPYLSDHRPGLYIDVEGLHVDDVGGAMLAKYPVMGLKLRRGSLDFKYLKQMAVADLDLHNVVIRGDERAVAELRLRSLVLDTIAWTNISVLGSIHTLERLSIRQLPLGIGGRDLSVLATLTNLQSLQLEGEWGTGLVALQGLPIADLGLTYNRVLGDLTALRNLPLKRLSLRGSHVSDLSFAEGMGLACLDISETMITNIAPLRGMKLNELLMEGLEIPDLTPLEGMKLRLLVFNPEAVKAGGECVLDMAETLEGIGTRMSGKGSDVTRFGEFRSAQLTNGCVWPTNGWLRK